MARENTCCSYCGARFEAGPFPKACKGCGETTWLNPKPIIVVLAPIGPLANKLVGIVRGIPPNVGGLVLPGGYVDPGESLREAASRELREETNVLVAPERFEILCERPTPDGRFLLCFALCPSVAATEADLPPFIPNEEVQRRVVLLGIENLAFPLHHEVMREYIASLP
jgi:ADP-ribose pyrophosphatase YjhB (NUDIX family)